MRKRLSVLILTISMIGANRLIAETVPRDTEECQTANPQHLSGKEAYRLSGLTDDFHSKHCFHYISAKQGFAPGQEAWAHDLAFNELYEESFLWMKKSANQGNAEAAWNVYVAYYHGRGTAQDPKKAEYWRQIALKDPVVRAQIEKQHVTLSDVLDELDRLTHVEHPCENRSPRDPDYGVAQVDCVH